jgi:excisionase family DNA binding protein
MLTVSEAAKRMGVQESTVRAWVMRRRIPHLKIGRSVRIEEKEVDRLLAQCRVPAKKEVAL